MIRLFVLGKVDLLDADGTPVATVLNQPKRLALLARLALAGPGAYTSRETLMALFWPDFDAPRARRSLSQAVHFLRGELRPEVIVSRQDGLAVSSSTLWCDAVEFEEAYSRGELKRALELYRGELLPGTHVDAAPEFDQWLETKRRALHQRAGRGAVALAEWSVTQRQPGDAGRWARQAIALSPTDETVVQSALRVLDRIGDRTGALASYDAFARRIREEFDVEPAAETVQLVQQVRDRVVPSLEPVGAPEATLVADAAPPDEAHEPGAVEPEPRRRRSFQLGAVAVALVLVSAIALWAVNREDARGTGAASPPRIAVEEFRDLSGDGSLDHLANALTDAVVAQLAEVEGLEVVSAPRQPALRATEADEGGRPLELLVRGGILRSGDSLRIPVELVDARAGRTIGAATVQRADGELFELIDDASQQIASHLRVRLGRQVRLQRWRAGTENVRAWELMQRAELALDQARQLHGNGAASAAMAAARMGDSLLVRAAREDPRWAEPHVARARHARAAAWMALFPPDVDPPRAFRLLDQGIDYASEALRQQPDHAGALELRGSLAVLLWTLRNADLPGDAQRLRQAEEDLRAAVASDPRLASGWNSLGLLLAARGRFDEAHWAGEQALRNDAFLEHAPSILGRLVLTSYEIGDTTSARRWCGEIGTRFPTTPLHALCELQLLAWIGGPRNVAVPRAREILGQSEASLPPNHPVYLQLNLLRAGVLARSGVPDSASAVMDRVRATGSADPELLYLEAFARMYLGQTDSAAVLLTRYVEGHRLARAGVAASRRFAPLREDPRVRSLRLPRE